jgi:hypothetical protein
MRKTAQSLLLGAILDSSLSPSAIAALPKAGRRHRIFLPLFQFG